MLFDFLFLQTISFEYEINFLKDLWYLHFVDFCLLLTFKDILYIFFVFYVLTICSVNLIFLTGNISWFSLLMSPIKIMFDFIFIYSISKMIFLLFYFFLYIYFQELSEVLILIFLIFLSVIFIFFVIFFPFVYFKFSNKIIYKKLLNI